MDDSETMREVRKIKEQCSLARLARTPEEQKIHSDEVRKRFEMAIGRKIEIVDFSKGKKEAVHA
jgi:hypothetical protein